MKYQLTGVNIPASIPRVSLVVRIIDGSPVLFTSDGRFVEGQRDLVISARMESVLSCKADFLLPAMQDGLPEGTV